MHRQTRLNQRTFKWRLSRTADCILDRLDKVNSVLSHDVAVIQWITSYHKNCMTTRIITLWRVHVTSLTTSASVIRFLIQIMFILKAIKSHLERHTINRILHSWSFYMKFMKLAEGSFHKSYGMTTGVRSSTSIFTAE